MASYIDGFIFPIPKNHLNDYVKVAESVAKIWLEHGAVSYQEFIGDDFSLQATASFLNAAGAKDNEVVIFGWAVFKSKKARDRANKLVSKDSRMVDLVKPLMRSEKLIFDSSRMAYAGFKPLVNC